MEDLPPRALAALETLLRLRRDVRRFRLDPLPADRVAHLLRLTALAPSVGLSQPTRLVLVEDPARREAVRASFRRCNAEALAAAQPERRAAYAGLKLAGLDRAPVHVAVFSVADPAQGHGLGRHTMPETLDYSAVLAIHTLWLAACADGIGLGWVSILDPAEIRAALDVPADWRFVAYLCLGLPEREDDVPELERRGWERRRPAVILRR
ncbi:5,6-dimethylbenzimidazole synthase [Aureimonas flava]|uniref:5,6-dimethylbenzimidazole synthase n=1 Tax=Aureimonas flava TaxID=2320271 RepID=A0A3A1WM18_9HYPH|nr:5,6-dimethylbenzimidazole synthase [Aureimonas flava]RIY00777.1 5,6-dimethylbenzimidazole synthase [Aureimonas flava]